jgi:predicted phosphodiesterase
MRLYVLSDLHLEFSDFPTPNLETDVVILAGDIGLRTSGVDWASRMFANKQVIYVAGNHEFYRLDRAEVLHNLRDKCDEFGFHFLENRSVTLFDASRQLPIRFLGTTLWTDFMLFGAKLQNHCMDAGRRCLNDFRLIRDDDGIFSVEKSISLHKESLMWLCNELNKPFDGKTVVVSHHLPSTQSVALRFKDDPLSACFASELSHLFGLMDLWVHGHTHDSFDYQMNGTRVVCNPRGYVRTGYAENVDFDPSLVVEV